MKTKFFILIILIPFVNVLNAQDFTVFPYTLKKAISNSKSKDISTVLMQINKNKLNEKYGVNSFFNVIPVYTDNMIVDQNIVRPPGGCGGCGVENCIMHASLTSGMVDDIHFCLSHMRTVHNGATPNPLIAASEKRFEFQDRKLRDEGFSLTISMANNVFLECQPIHVILKIKNLSMVNDSIAAIWVEEDISLKDELTGKKITPRIILDFFEISYIHFEPGEGKTFDFDLDFNFASQPLISETKETGEKYQDCFYVPSGRYSVVIEKSGIVSNRLSFEVVKPEGQDLIELNELGSAFTKRDFRYRIDKLYDFLIKYPDSKYYERALSNYESSLIVNGSSNDYINLITVADKWFEKDTESEFAKGLIRYLGSVSKTSFKEAKKKIIEYLNKIVTDHPGTTISIWSAAYLKLLKNQ